MSSERAHELIENLFGPTDPEADRRVAIMHAHAAALSWAQDITGSYPAPRHVAERLSAAADDLKENPQDAHPRSALIEVAVRVLAEDRHSAA